ncbi:MAG TPA: hypothetical protein VFF05_00410 [Rudaea sp.]|jgi:hypothetical protein|nr:hypothetical protein [Rudaea sp.]
MPVRRNQQSDGARRSTKWFSRSGQRHLYALFMPPRQIFTKSLFHGVQIGGQSKEAGPVDALYLLLLVLLIAGTAGFLRACARLEPKK